MSIETGASQGPNKPSEGVLKFNPKISAAMKYSELLSDELMQDERSSEIAMLFRQSTTGMLLSHSEIASLVILDDFFDRPNIARRAVQLTIERMIPKAEYKELNAKRATLMGELRVKRIGKDVIDEQLARGRETFETNVKEGKTIVDSTRVVEGMGRVRWTENEFTLLKALATSPYFQHHTDHPLRNNTPDWKKIAAFINDIMHEGETVRTDSAASNWYKDFRTKQSKSRE